MSKCSDHTLLRHFKVSLPSSVTQISTERAHFGTASKHVIGRVEGGRGYLERRASSPNYTLSKRLESITWWALVITSCIAASSGLQAQGNAAFSAGKFVEAADLFSQAIAVDPGNHVLYSNKSAALVSPKGSQDC